MSAPSVPRRRAAALAYEASDVAAHRAPRVAAKGRGWLAEEIIARARAAGVPIHESRELVDLLLQVDLDREIPAALYFAVAEVLAWVYRLEHGVTVVDPLSGATAENATRSARTVATTSAPVSAGTGVLARARIS